MTRLYISLVFQIIFYVDMLIRLLIFRQISGLNLKFRKMATIAFVLLVAQTFSSNSFIIWEPFSLLAVIRFLKIRWNNTQKIFYGLLPAVISDMFMRIIGLYLRFLFDVDITTFNNSVLFNSLLTVLLIPFYLYFFKGLGIEAKDLQVDISDKSLKDIFLGMNTLFTTYLFLIRGNLALGFSFEKGLGHLNWDTYFIQTNILLVYFVLFTASLLFLNYRLKEKKDKELQNLKDRQLFNLSKYSKHVESLYQEIRNFRHDYTNILISLNEAIKAEDVPQIRNIYQTVIADSDKKFYEGKYDIARLANIQNDAMKSLLSSKVIEAQSKGIEISVEVDTPIDAPNIELIDFITILSIFLDNAIEAAEKTDKRNILFAYFDKVKCKVLVIENSIQEEKMDTTLIFDYGYSSKDDNRGIGLANVKTILNKYPNVSLSTNSSSYKFSQEMVFFE